MNIFLILALIMVVPPADGVRITSNVTVCIDVSGSMQGRVFRTAVNWVCQYLEQNTDEYRIRVVAFNDDAQLVSDWIELPDAEKLKEIQERLLALRAAGNTSVLAGLREALKDPPDKHTVLLVSDGIFTTESRGQVRQTTRRLNRHKTPIFIYSPVPRTSTHLTFLAKEFGGAYVKEGTK